MELRKAEQEVDRLKSEWKTLRRKNASYDDNDTVNLFELPSWKELISRVVDDDIFPIVASVDEVEEVTVESDVAVKGSDKDVESRTEQTNTNNKEETGFSEWGMLITGSSLGQDTKEKTATESTTRLASCNKAAEAIQEKTEEESDDEDASVVNELPPEVIHSLESLSESIETLQPKIDKFIARLTERDPVTKKPRYGERAIIRVKKIIRMHRALEIGLSTAFDDDGVVQNIKIQIKRHEEKIHAQAQEIEAAQRLEVEKIEQERRLEQQRAEEQRIKDKEAKQKEVEDFAQRASEARLRRMEDEQRAIDAEEEADRELLALVPFKGTDGVRMQIDRMRKSLKDEKKALDVALGSLYTLFDQIVRKPEEVNYRKIRRDHPKFIEDIGRHVGGKEVLIAAGFRLDKLDGVPCFFSKEPHIESDMDGWSGWFDGLQQTLAIIEEEMMK